MLSHTLRLRVGWRAHALLMALLLLTAVAPMDARGALDDRATADALTKQGTSAFHRGAFTEAVRVWHQAGQLYHELQLPLTESRALALLGQGYHALGNNRQAVQTMELALALAQQGRDREWQTELQGKIGALYMGHRQFDAAGQYLTEALASARNEGLGRVVATTLNDLGRWHSQQQRLEDAVRAFSESAILAKVQKQQPLEVRAVLNNATALIQLGRLDDAKKWLALSTALIDELPPSYDKSFGLLTQGLLAAEFSEHSPEGAETWRRDSARSLSASAVLADSLGDQRTASYAWGYLGRLYERDRRYDEAAQLSSRAVVRAQTADAPESLFRWQWQRGRLLAAEGQLDQAIDAYRHAVYTLQPLRPELAMAADHPTNTLDVPAQQIYLELADLLLKRASLTEPQAAATTYLAEAREVVELQKVAQMRDYYRDECLDALQTHATKLDAVSPKTAVLYPIIFNDRTEVLLSLPTGLKQISIPITKAVLTDEIRTFRRLLERRTTREYLPHAQQLYTWLIQPLENDLTAYHIETLVIVPDAALRTIPLAALHDGRQFLIRKYAVATSPGLSLTDSRPIDRSQVRLLSGGLTQSVRGFPPLPDVASELKTIRALYGGHQLMNQQFLIPTLEQELKDSPYTIVHLASHGKFEGDVRQTYLLTYDDRLNMDRLARFVGLLRFRNEPLELLTLSACETAAGDESAALGLAGVAIKAGAKSALATLWYINDQASAQLVTEFYSQLQQAGSSKAAALQRAQWKLLEDPIFEHPAYWSPFLLLNNWL